MATLPGHEVHSLSPPQPIEPDAPMESPPPEIDELAGALEALRCSISVGSEESVASQRDGNNSEQAAADVPAQKEKASPYVVCDLCNAVVLTPLPDHLRDEHGDTDLLSSHGTSHALWNSKSPAQQSGANDKEMAARFNSQLGAAAHAAVAHADRGPEYFSFITAAMSQMQALLQNPHEGAEVFLFGSCLTMGLWDGMGDADFTLYNAKKSDPDTGEPPHKVQSAMVMEIARKLRNGGFQFEELEVVRHTRVPLVRRRRDTKRPCQLQRQAEPYLVEYRFPSPAAKASFLRSEGSEIRQRFRGTLLAHSGTHEAVFAIPSGAKALKLFKRVERVGPATKTWKLHSRLPEVFFVDFDISCRSLGVRNSWLIRRYMEQSSIIRAGSLFIKKWSKQCGINNPRRGFLTSYAVSCLWLYYLLRCGHARFVDPASLPLTPTPAAYGLVSYMPLWPALEDESSAFVNLGEALHGFFRFYAVTFDWDHEVVSLRRDCSSGDPATITTKEELGWSSSEETDAFVLKDRVFYRVCIEDVYETNLNLGRHLSPLKVEWLLGQFRAALAWCEEAQRALSTDTGAGGCKVDTGAWGLLFRDGYLKGAEAGLAAAVHRHLVANGGMATVHELRAMLREAHPDLLSTYEVFHRLSELWYDHQGCEADAANNRRYGRHGIELAPPPALHESQPDVWAAVSYAALLPCEGSSSAAAGVNAKDRVVFLANGEILPSGEALPTGSAVQAWLAAKRPVFDEAAKRIAAISATLGSSEALWGGGVNLGEETTGLVANAFLTVDGRAFRSYSDREVFIKHLTAVADCLAETAPAQQVAQLLKRSPQKGSVEAAVAVVAGFFDPDGSVRVDPHIVSEILFDEQYVHRHATTGTPARTALLLTYGSQDATEEVVERVRPPLATHADSNEGGSRGGPKPILRNPAAVTMGTCYQCKTTGVNIYGTNQPKVDGGRYCMGCWDAY